MQKSGLPLLNDVIAGKHDHQLPTRVQEITRRQHAFSIPLNCGYIICSHCLKIKLDDGKKQCPLCNRSAALTASRQGGGMTTVTRGSSANPAVSVLHYKHT